MRVTPQTEKQVTEANLLPAGSYPFTVQVAEEKTSKKGNPMIAVQLEVYDEDGKGRRVNDYLMESVAYKLRHFAYAVGLGPRYEAGELNAAEMQGLTGKCLIKIEPAKDGYDAKNSVKDYIVVEKASPQVPQKDAASNPSEPPF